MYGIAIWGKGKGIGKIVKYQKWALRTALGLKYNAHTTYYFKKYELLKFEDIKDQFILTKLHQVARGEGHPSYNAYLTFHRKKNRTDNIFETPFPDTQITKLPQYLLPVTWNGYKISETEFELPFPQFKRHMKAIMLERYDPKCRKANCFICKN